MNQIGLTYVGKQAIYDRSGKVIASELLYRDSEINRFPTHMPSIEATACIISNQLLNSRFIQMPLPELYFVNFDETAILRQYPKMLSPDNYVIEILEQQIMSKELLNAAIELRSMNYRIALDDFDITRLGAWLPLMKYVSIIKVDVLKFDVFDVQVQGTLKQIKSQFPSITLLAEKVESEEVYSHCLKLGFELFQGYFLSPPVVSSTFTIPPRQQTLHEITRILRERGFDIEEISRTVVTDEGLRSRLLNLAVTSNNLKDNYSNHCYLRKALVRLGQGLFTVFFQITSLSSQVNYTGSLSDESATN